MSFPIAEFWDQYVDATLTIHKVIEETIHHMPHVLIDTETGDLYNKTGHMAFKALPVYDELPSSIAIRLHLEHIQKEIKEF